ncbi:MAG TPA: GNAT family N-acetyltransferase [Chloroflexia bacterium]|nr:GNAT family N-acetyltransferase [Chloroflexia bacterium]
MKLSHEVLTVTVATPAVSPGMKELQEVAIQEGIIKTRIKVRVKDAYNAYEADRPGSQTFLAYLPGTGVPVGTISGWPHLVYYGGSREPLQAVLVNRLAVHPDYRKQGIAKALWNELNHWIKATFGEELLVYGYFQKGNAASKAWFHSAGGKFTGREVLLTPVKTLPLSQPANPIPPIPGYEIRKDTTNDYEAVVGGLNRFYRGYDFYWSEEAATLGEWLGPKIIDGRPLQLTDYYVLMDKGGRPVAGAGVFYQSKLFDVKVVKMPAVVRLLNGVLKLVPANGSLASTQVTKLWYEQEHLEAAQLFWHELRRLESANGSSLLIYFDRKGQIPPVLNLSKLQPVSHNYLVILNQPFSSSADNNSNSGSEAIRPIFYL